MGIEPMMRVLQTPALPLGHVYQNTLVEHEPDLLNCD